MDSAHYGFYTDLLDVFPNFIACLILLILSICIDVVQDSRERTLVSDVVMVLVFILDEAVGLLIDRIIGKMHAQVIQVAAHGAVVRLSSKSGKAFLVDEASERVHTCYQNINSEVKLQAINEVGLVQISLRDIVLTLYDPITIPRQEYTFALAH